MQRTVETVLWYAQVGTAEIIKLQLGSWWSVVEMLHMARKQIIQGMFGAMSHLNLLRIARVLPALRSGAPHISVLNIKQALTKNFGYLTPY